MHLKNYPVYCFLFLISCASLAQNVALSEQFNGRFDFTFIGNTLNYSENNLNTNCLINTTSSADLNLNPTDQIEKAYLYWAGSGTGDFDVKLNNNPIVATTTYSLTKNGGIYFSAFADVTTMVQTNANGNYTFSDLDLNATINTSVFCVNRTNFGGWAMIVIYKNVNLPLNQLNVYSGLQGMQGLGGGIAEEINITLNSLNVIDNVGAKIGFIAWEGDSTLAVNETLQVNGTVLSNALNPPTNAFNGTNSITNTSNLYNMDLDVYDIQNNIAIGDATAQIKMSSGQDFVMINAIITKLNSQLPDATITIDDYKQSCDSKTISVDFTVYNNNSTNPLPANVPVAIYANGSFVQTTATLAAIPIGGSQNLSVVVVLPNTIPNNFTLQFVVDSNQNGLGTVTEILENNNAFSIPIVLWVAPKFNALMPIIACNEGLGKGTFDFLDYNEIVKVNANNVTSFFESFEDAANNNNPIFNTANYTSLTTPKEIFIRLQDENQCFSITSFQLLTKNCPPQVYNLIATNADNFYDTMQIDGLKDVFLNFKLSIFNRWGTLVWTGNNNTENFAGKANEGISLVGNDLPEGTYYYILDLNDVNYSSPLNGFLHLMR